jgi:hypothetical protein
MRETLAQAACSFAFFAKTLLIILEMSKREPTMSSKPGRQAFTEEEWNIIQSHRTPVQVQRYLSSTPYNRERGGETLRTFRGVVGHREAHCLEAALAAATIMEQHGYPPLLLDLESQDKLDHVVFIYRRNGLWGSIARSRDTGLHGRKAIFHHIRHLVWSYFDPYVDNTARLTAYGVANLYDLGTLDWRLSTRHVWEVEQHLYDIPHRPLKSSDKRHERLLARYRKFHQLYPEESPTYFANRHQWVL